MWGWSDASPPLHGCTTLIWRLWYPIMLLSDLPLDVLLASVLPQLDVMSLLALSATCRSFRELVTGDLAEPLWHGRLVRDLNFPAASSARTAGWYDLYRRVASSTTYTWGETRNHRLGIDQNRLHSLIGQQPDRDGIYAPTAVHLPATVVALCAGGWSMHALDATGKIWHWGQLDGQGWAALPRLADRASQGHAGPSDLHLYLHPSRPAPLPRLLPVTLPRIVSMDCGRSHIVALDQDGTIYELHAWSRALQVVDRDNQWRPGKQVRTIMAGWSFSAVAMKDGRCFVWWAPDEAGFSDDDERDEAPATGILRDVEVDSLLLPGLPDSDEGEEVIVQLACGDNFVVARSASSRVYDLDLSIPLGWQGGWPERRERLRHALHSVERTWRFLPRFSEPANGARISHVQAHYTHFAALSPASPRDTSVVLLGHRGDPEPRVLPTLQGAGIVQLSMGDYHFGAIDDRGVLRTWGAATTGRLGLGDEGRRTGTVEEPTVVDLHGGFAFHLAFAGWHSAALVLRDPSKPEPAKEAVPAVDDSMPTEEPVLPQMPGAFPLGGSPPPLAPLMRGHPAFRIGYAARGAMRGRGMGRGAF